MSTGAFCRVWYWQQWELYSFCEGPFWGCNLSFKYKLMQLDRFEPILHKNKGSLERNIQTTKAYRLFRSRVMRTARIAHAGFGTGAASVGDNVTDRSSSSELDSPRKCERIVLAEACTWEKNGIKWSVLQYQCWRLYVTRKIRVSTNQITR